MSITNELKNKRIFFILLILTVINISSSYILYELLTFNYSYIANVIITFLIESIIYFLVFKKKIKNNNFVEFEIDISFILILQIILNIFLINILNLNSKLVILISNAIIGIILFVYIYIFIIKLRKKISDIIIFTMPIFFIFLIVLLSYWPGLILHDSLIQWNQTRTNLYFDWHPVTPTLIIKFFTLLSDTLGIMLIFQLLALATSFAYVLNKIKKYYGINRIFLYFITILFAIFPVNFYFAIVVLKDTMFSVFILLVTAFMLDITNNKQWISKWYNILKLAIILLLMILFRHNGIAIVILLIVTMFIILKQDRKNILKLLIILVGMFVISNIVINSCFYVAKSKNAMMYSAVSHLFARMLNTPSVEFTEEETEKLSKFVDLSTLKSSFSEYNTISSMNCQKNSVLKENGDEYVKLCIKKVLQYPEVFIVEYEKLTSFLWAPVKIEKSAESVGILTQTNVSDFRMRCPQLVEDSKFPSLLQKIKELINSIQQKEQLDFIFERPAMWMYVSILSIIIISIKYQNKKMLLILLPSIYNTISLIPFFPAHMIKYVYPTILVGWFLISWGLYEVYSWIKYKKTKNNFLKIEKGEV